MSGASVGTREPRWPALAALLAIGLLYLALPERLALGPSWLLPALIMTCVLVFGVSHWRQHRSLNQIVTLTANGIVTIAMIGSVIALVRQLPTHRETPMALLRSAGALWLTNVLVFALWYWRLDAGGPHERDARKASGPSAFYFPQMMRRDAMADGKAPAASWRPGFVDYLFLAFNTSTAFSPTDTAVLLPWAKMAMMLQSLVSLSVLTLLAARAVGLF